MKKRAAMEYILSKEGIALGSLLASVLVYFWLTNALGFRLPPPNARLFSPLSFMTLHLVFLIPASLALASKKITRYLIALPYLILLGFGLLGVIVHGVDSFSERSSVIRGNLSFIVACAVPAALVALLRSINEAKKRRVYVVALVSHLVLLAGIVYYYTYHYGVWHLAEESVSVQRLRLSDGEFGFPLVEEDAAYIVDRQGRLYQVELAAGRKRLLAQIPRPTPAEAGFPGVTLPPVARDASSPFLLEGTFIRLNSNEIAYQYHYIATEEGIFTMHVRINQESGQVSWQLRERTLEPFVPLPVYRVTKAQGRMIRVSPSHGLTNPFSVLIEGEGIKTAIDPMGSLNWTQAKHGWILVGTNRGMLLIITLNR